jgi:hypothetical protein
MQYGIYQDHWLLMFSGFDPDLNTICWRRKYSPAVMVNCNNSRAVKQAVERCPLVLDNTRDEQIV